MIKSRKAARADKEPAPPPPPQPSVQKEITWVKRWTQADEDGLTKSDPHKRIFSNSALNSALSSKYPSRAPSPVGKGPRKPFRFFDLPAELRVRVYEEVLGCEGVVDLHPDNRAHIRPRLALFHVSRRMHAEAHRIFYAQPLRLFPTHGRFHTKKPLLQRLPPLYRSAITVLEFRLGPDWSSPPACQNTKPALGLADCTRLRTLKIFVELDPSANWFTGFRGRGATKETYQQFCVGILKGIFEQVGSLETVEVDAWPSLGRETPLVVAVEKEVKMAGRRLIWGAGLVGDEGVVQAATGMGGIEEAMAGLSIKAPEVAPVVEVGA